MRTMLFLLFMFGTLIPMAIILPSLRWKYPKSRICSWLYPFPIILTPVFFFFYSWIFGLWDVLEITELFKNLP